MIVKKSPWCDEAAAALSGLIDSALLPLYRQWIDCGTAILWRICGGEWVTWLITRVEQFPNGQTELVFDAIAGSNARNILRHFIAQAKRLGISGARFESHHPESVLAKSMGHLGFKRVATTFRADL